MEIEEIGRGEFDGAALVRDHPPRYTLEHKRRLYEAIDVPIGGTLKVSRWGGRLPATLDSGSATEVEVVTDHFTYPPDTVDMTRWHMNFADRRLFIAYGLSLMAQDEIQCMEHPVLGSLREALVAGATDSPGLTPFTRDRDRPTPVLVRGAQRSMAIDTGQGVYGNAFARAPYEAVMAATRFIEPPTFSNIVAMEAPPGGRGPYSRREIEDILTTAFIGFRACRLESGSVGAIVHTGNWGTGAYGGDRVLMALLQLIAARLAGLERLVFHSRGGADHVEEAQRLLDSLPLANGSRVDDLIGAIHGHGFVWGFSDGN